MNRAAVFGGLVIAGALLAYFLNFNEWLGFSGDKGEWGAFGDFVGGFSNPILTFITMCLLIGSINLQREANTYVVRQGAQIDDAAKRQREVDDLRSFESTFFSLAQAARQEYERLEVVDDSGKIHRAGGVVCFIEEVVLRYKKYVLVNNRPSDFDKLFDKLDERSGMGVFSCVRSFYILFRFACESCPEKHKERYVDVCLYIMPVRYLNLICLARAYENWEILDYLEGNGLFGVKGLDEYLSTWVGLKKD